MVSNCVAARYTSATKTMTRRIIAAARQTRSPENTVVLMFKWWHMAWIDITVGIQNRMPHWPTDPAPNIYRVADMNRGDVCNVTAISIPAHTGTHLDAPLHFIRDAQPIDRMPLDAGIGEARVISISNPEVVT